MSGHYRPDSTHKRTAYRIYRRMDGWLVGWVDGRLQAGRIVSSIVHRALVGRLIGDGRLVMPVFVQ